MSIVQVLTGEHHTALHKNRTTFTVKILFVTEGNIALRHLSERFRRIVNHTHFERCRTTQNVLGLGRILNARELNHDTIGTLLSNNRFCNAQFVNTIVQGRNVLL